MPGTAKAMFEALLVKAPLVDAQVLAQLLVLACDPGLAAAARMQQCLTVFFHAYAPLSAAAQERLCAAALPAARRALSAGPSPAKSAAPQLLRYVLSLLQVRLFRHWMYAGFISPFGGGRAQENVIIHCLAPSSLAVRRSS